MVSRLPPDDIYPGYSLHTLGSSPAVEKKIVKQFLLEIGIQPQDKNIEEIFRFISELVDYIRVLAPEELRKIKSIQKPMVGAAWDSIINLAYIILIAEIISPISKLVLKDGYNYLKKWIATKKKDKKSEVSQLLELSPEETILILKIRKKLEENKREIFDNIEIFVKQHETNLNLK